MLVPQAVRGAGSASMPPAGVTMIGDLFHAGYDRQLTGQLHLSGEDGEVFVPAYSIEDTETQRDLLCDQITVPVPSDWVGRPGRTMTVKGIEDIRVHD